jgi:hypothetical protein
MFQTPTEIQGFDKRTVKAYGHGNVTLQMRLPEGRHIPTRITNVWYIPNFFNLVSQSKLMDANLSMEIINHYGINIYAPSGSLAATAPPLNGLFCLDIVHDTSKSVGMDRIDIAPILAAIKETGFATTKEATQATLWHRCLCHLGPQALKLYQPCRSVYLLPLNLQMTAMNASAENLYRKPSNRCLYVHTSI